MGHPCSCLDGTLKPPSCGSISLLRRYVHVKFDIHLPVRLLDLILGSLGLDAQGVVEFGFSNHGGTIEATARRGACRIDGLLMKCP